MKNQENLIHKFELTQALVDKLLSSEVKSILVLGASNTGKTTFIEALGDIFINASISAQIIDSDVGQSHIGAPCTISSGFLCGEFKNWKDIEVKDISFTGSLSPAGNLKCVLDSFKKICDSCFYGSQKLIIDTTGYILGDEAVALKVKKAQISRPDIIIAIEQTNELESILSRLGEFDIYRIAIQQDLSKRSYAQRSAYRQARFKYYFSNNISWKLDSRLVKFIAIGDDGLNFELTQDAIFDRRYQDRLISFRENIDGFEMGLGIIKGQDRQNCYVEVVSPPFNKTKVNFIMVGKVKDKGDFVIEDVKD